MSTKEKKTSRNEREDKEKRKEERKEKKLSLLFCGGVGRRRAQIVVMQSSFSRALPPA